MMDPVTFSLWVQAIKETFALMTDLLSLGQNAAAGQHVTPEQIKGKMEKSVAARNRLKALADKCRSED